MTKKLRAVIANVLFFGGVVAALVGLGQLHISAALIVGGCAASWAGYRVFSA